MNENRNCPCKKLECERHGDCAACKEHHRSVKKKVIPECERLKLKEEKENSKRQK